MIQNWNSNQNGKWGANVDGGGTVGGHSIQFNGAAAGTIDSSKTFSGTGSGIVKESSNTAAQGMALFPVPLFFSGIGNSSSQHFLFTAL